MSKMDVKQFVRKPALLAVVTLILGVALGVGAEHYQGNKSPAPRTLTDKSADRDTTAATAPPNSNDWDPFREMRQMQQQMDQMFAQSIARFHMEPQLNGFPDDAGYSLSLDVRDLKDRYEVHALLPDAKAADTKVKLEGNQLRVTVANHETAALSNTNGASNATEWGQYEQVVTLAGDLKADQMKVEHKNHELLITIPKG